MPQRPPINLAEPCCARCGGYALTHVLLEHGRGTNDGDKWFSRCNVCEYLNDYSPSQTEIAEQTLAIRLSQGDDSVRYWRPFEDPEPNLMATPLAAIGVPLMIVNLLEEADVFTVGDALYREPRELLAIPGISIMKLGMLRQRLKAAGFGKRRKVHQTPKRRRKP